MREREINIVYEGKRERKRSVMRMREGRSGEGKGERRLVMKGREREGGG